MGPSTGLFDVGGQRLATPPIRGRANELTLIGALVTALVQGRGRPYEPHALLCAYSAEILAADSLLGDGRRRSKVLIVFKAGLESKGGTRERI